MTAPDVDGLREADGDEGLKLALAQVMSRWGVRSRHAQWSDGEAQQDAANEALAQIRPVLDVLRSERDAAQRSVDDYGPIVQEHYDRAEKAEAEVAALTEQINRVKALFAKDADFEPCAEPCKHDDCRTVRAVLAALDGAS